MEIRERAVLRERRGRVFSLHKSRPYGQALSRICSAKRVRGAAFLHKIALHFSWKMV